MFAEGLEDISQNYLLRIDPRNIVGDGLSALGTIDQELSVRVKSNELDLIYRGQSAGSFAVTGQPTPDDWAQLMARLLEAAREASPVFKAADSELVYNVIFDAMLGHLDPPFSRYAGRDQARQDQAAREGYAGIGVHVSSEDDGAHITSVIPDTPAERVGLHADDVIVAIDQTPTEGLDQQAVVNLLRGPVASPVTLAVRRSGGGGLVTMSVTRDVIPPDTVTSTGEGNFAYFRIYQFGKGTADNLRRQVTRALGDGGGEVRGVILDLRDDPGGLLDQGIAVARLFLKGGHIVSIRGRNADDDQVFDATGEDISGGLPIAVLINAGTASASEIVASALQDHDRAVIIGSGSVGKGTVQAVHRMPNDGELILTIARFYAPSGYTLHHIGILPTVCTSGQTEGASAILGELRVGQLPRLPIAQRQMTAPEDVAGVERLRSGCPAFRGSNPVDLAVASGLLAEPALYAKAIALADPGAMVPK